MKPGKDAMAGSSGYSVSPVCFGKNHEGVNILR
jgi:hypothetical protein